MKIDLRKLSGLSSGERSFVTLYFAGPEDLKAYDKWKHETTAFLKDQPDEAEHFTENCKLIDNYFERNKYKSGSLCLIACWMIDLLEEIKPDLKFDTAFRVDSSPYIKPLAMIQDEYETYIIIATDNRTTKIYSVSMGSMQDEEKIRGDIKNHVKVGGWSQQRYERRRDKELKHYTKDIVNHLAEIEKVEDFSRIILAGTKETISLILGEMPKHLKDKVIGEKQIDLSKGESEIEKDTFSLFEEAERAEERDLWKKIKARYKSHGLAVLGAERTLEALKTGRVEEILIDKSASLKGARCRNCENLWAGEDLTKCPACGSNSVFSVDLTEEMIELAELTSAGVEFAEGIPGLVEIGGIAAVLRY
jgi:peptide subunit release factor 1 (eRF1)